jgi:CubicO group peptidase (beta-lactamase class C family)
MFPKAITRWLVIAAVASVALTASPAAAASPHQQADVAARIDDYMRGRMLTLHTPGVSLVVVEGDQVLLSRGYGFADRESGTPMTEDTPVPVASTNKGMTALAMMQLVEQGLVDLDAPVVRYVPEFTMDDARAKVGACCLTRSPDGGWARSTHSTSGMPCRWIKPYTAPYPG